MKSSASEPGLNYRKLPLVVSPGRMHPHEGLLRELINGGAYTRGD